MTLPQSHNAKPFSQEVRDFKNEMKEMGDLYRLKQLNFPDSLNTSEKLSAHFLRIEMMLNTTAVRNWSYEHSMKRVTLELAKKVRSPFIEFHDFDPVVFLQLIYSMIDEVEKRINEHRKKVRSFAVKNNFNAVIESYESSFPVIKHPKEERIVLWNKIGKDLLELKSILMLHSDYYLEDLLTFDFTTLESYTDHSITENKLKEIFGKISYKFGDLASHNIEHFLLGNPVNEKPFIALSDNLVYSSMYSVLTHLSIGILESFCAEDIKLREKYNLARGEYLEDEVARLFKNAFPEAQLYRGSMWSGKDGKKYENDLLMVIGRFALVVEAKAGLVSPSAKRGAPERLFKTLQELIEAPSEQTLRFIEFLNENKGELSLKVRKGPNNEFDSSNLKYFIPLGVTLSHLGMTGSNLKQLINAGVTNWPIEKLACSVSLTDLEIVFDLLPSSTEKLHYLQRRRELESNIEYLGDELDLLAWYLDEGFNFGNTLEKYGFFKIDLKSKELDNYIIGSAKNEKVKKPSFRKTQWWIDILKRLEDKKPDYWIEMSYILYNIHFNDQLMLRRKADIMIKDVKSGRAKNEHNWIILHSGEKGRSFAVVFYCYSDQLKDERHHVMDEILHSEDLKDAKGKIVIALNADQKHYPYSSLAFLLDPELFDNKYLSF